MYNNISFIDRINMSNDNLENEKNDYILIDTIPDTVFADINNLNFINNNIIGINVSNYFGYNSLINNNINKQTIFNLLKNIVIDNKLNILITKYYTINKYEKINLNILTNLYNNIISLHSKIICDCEISCKKKYDLDIVNKAIAEYFENNINKIIENFFIQIKVFYILSIILNKDKLNYLLYFNDNLNNKIKFTLGIN